ncbi:hypothetical protein D499_0Z00460 [Hanseniaspora uvarum DSM 2768]|nr:hypothetical protein FOG50_02060 [Hanseniaspora uvarum]KKA01554.1 hypothetical protein D499_0Z00460 [Hanseniaspora uvarum DSM 2768]
MVQYNTQLISTLFILSTLFSQLNQVEADCTESGGNYYCNSVSGIKYENIGYSGSYMDVTSMDESSCECSQSSYSFSGTNSPLDEQLSVHFRGPINLKQFGVYYPSGSSSSKKREHHGHAHKREAKVPKKQLQERALVVDVVDVYSTVYVDQNGNTISEPATTTVAATSVAAAPGAVDSTSSTIETTTVAPTSNSLLGEDEFLATSSSSSSAYQASSSSVAAVASTSSSSSEYVAPSTSSQASSSSEYVAPSTSSQASSSSEYVASSTTSEVSSSSSASSTSSTSSSSSSSTSSSAWSRDSYYEAGSSADNVVFMNYYGGSGSGKWSSCFGNSLSYANSDASGGSSSSVALSDTTVESNVEFVVFSGTECSGNDCGYYRSDIPAYEGFGGAEKIFVFEFGMPTSTTTSSVNNDMPAVWLLNAKIPRTLQYGNAECSCWSTGCGELDLFEVLSSGEDKLISHIHDGQGDNGSSYGGSGSSDYFDRPTSGTMKAAVIFSSDSSIQIVKLDDSTTFGSSLDADTVSDWLNTASSTANNV